MIPLQGEQAHSLTPYFSKEMANDGQFINVICKMLQLIKV